MQQLIHKANNRHQAIAYVTQFFIAFGCAFLHSTYGSSIARDLVLTPKQGLQLHGKSIYYEDNGKEYLHNDSIRPWERTLKHVTFITLFADVASDAMARNDSTLQQYTQFLQSPYIGQNSKNAVRFGDIVTLASGWLERVTQNNNKSVAYRFHEGRCEHVCQAQKEQVLAIWQVQKIRHRNNNDRNFRYEMKFSISPLTAHPAETQATTNNDKESTLVKRKTKYESRPATLQRNFIQKEDDYPQNFGRIIYPEETQFADRHTQASNLEPQYVHATNNFISHLLSPPPPPARPVMGSLNIGEYMRDNYADKGFSKIELFPNIFSMLQPQPQFATTYRPHFSSDDIGSQPQQSLGNGKPPAVTHHYHHHYYMPPSGLENDLNNVEPTTNSISGVDSEINYLSQRFDEPPFQLPLPPAPEKISTPAPQLYADIQQQSVLHVTPMSQLKNSNYQLYPINFGNKGPFFLYPAAMEKNVKTTTPQVKPFIKSEPWLEDAIRYSEPDPLYTSSNYEPNKSQLEKPNGGVTEQAEHNKKRNDLDETSSLKDIKVSTEKDFQTTTPSEGNNISSLVSSTMHVVPSIIPKFTTTTVSTIQKPVTVAATETTRAPNFVSTSTATTKNALRGVGRYRNGNSRYRVTSTTEKPVLKWQPKRKNDLNNNNNSSSLSKSKDDDKISRHKKMSAPTVLPVLPTPHTQISTEKIHTSSEENNNQLTTTNQPEIIASTTTTTATTSKVATFPSILKETGNEIYEVLTQKSVSKSVSIKVGNNGEELPIVINDENEVSHKL